jgi:LAGLIDADG DNA endonuclease family protein
MATARIGRPVGSTNGRVPEGGYPEIDPELGGFLAGFIEGEACFSIPKQPKGSNHRCAMSVVARADDLPLLLELQQRTGLGSVRPSRAQGSSKPQATWLVTAKSDVQHLAGLLARHPLRGQKSHAYAIWYGALTWWIDGDPTVTHRNRDWSPMRYLHSRLTEAKRYSPGRTVPLLDSAAEAAELVDWRRFLAGFFTAEGTLGITVNSGNQFLPRATITVRADDWSLLLDLRSASGVGRVTREQRHPEQRAPAATWAVRDRAGLCRLVANFDEHRLRGRRQREYAIWREAVHEYVRGKSGPAMWARLSRRREILAAERKVAAEASITLAARLT